ncbi:MAG: PC4/YdbC family ssDNA-binding protein [Firmicutes bacterium]|nr:PC4/YdbC family ssDNA-binding protein [Bacillota bacterium]
MAEIKYDLVERLGVLSTDAKGWTKELNLVSWNERPAKYDMRSWNPDHTRMSKGITFSEDEAQVLLTILQDEFKN